MQDARVLEVDPIAALDALPPIAAPGLTLGPRAVVSYGAPDPLSLADPRPFRVDLEHGPGLAADEPALEQGKRRG
jgi:hypothetical protein